MTRVYETPLKRKVDKKKDETPLCAFDFETNGLGGDFIIGAFVTDDGIRELVYTISAAFGFIVDHPKYRYLAHNAAGYEFAYLYSEIYAFFQQEENIGIEPTLQGENRIVQFRITKNGKKWLDLRDTLCIFNMSLDKVGKAYCPELPKLSGTIDFEKETFNPHNEKHMEYLWRDCDTLLLAYQRLRDQIWQEFHCNLGVTAGRTAMNAFQTTLPEGRKYYRVGKKKEDFFRKAYYGACVFPGHSIGDWGNTTSIDINAAYGYQMARHDYPTSTPAYTVFYKQGKRGIYEVRATVPDDLFEKLGFNPVPYRDKYGLSWPSGTFTTYITDIEIEFARRVGCIIEVKQGYIWQECEPIFKEFINKCEALELGGDGQFKSMVKLLRNSLYGKFGTKPAHNKLLFSMDGYPDEPSVPVLNEQTGKPIEGIYLAHEESHSPHILPHIAAFITAWQRVYLMEFLVKCYAAGARNVYCDTDSIKCDSAVISRLINEGAIPIGNRYGEFKIEETVNEFIVLGSKCFYGSGTNDKGTRTEVKKCKGIPKRAINRKVYTDALASQRTPVYFDAVNNVMAIIKRRATTIATRRNRKITDITNSIAWRIDGTSISPRRVEII